MSKKLSHKVENGNVVVTLNISGKEWTSALESGKKVVLSNLEVKGFRKGHVPENIAKKHLSAGKVREEATNKIINANWNTAMEEMKDHNVISRPSVDLVKVSDNELEVTFTSALMPSIKLGKKSGFEAIRKIEKVLEEEIEKEMEQIKPLLMKKEELEKEVEEGDIVNIDFLGKKDGKKFDGGEAKGHDLKIGSNQFIPGFEEKIKGMKLGEEKVIELTFPETYPTKDLAGADVIFDVKINSIYREVELEGEELKSKLKEIGFQDMDDMKAKVTTMIEEKKTQGANDKFFSQAVTEIIEHDDTELVLPEVIVKDALDRKLSQFSQTISQQGMNLEQYLDMIGKTKEEFMDKDMKPQAEKEVKQQLVYQELIKQYNVETTDADVDSELQKIADAQGMTLEDVKAAVPVQTVKGSLTFSKLVEKMLK